ncbi:Lipid IVA 3-deoxy-D-manno-octulosonic acid transferase [often with also] [hydrothermal vent metagenome]|uniref:Lipid IVA 3-deoxy-D-manno-octulosonic acid transferase [often with also] n=1 Tax=hydrothermal vent metagenome TaxID=652676 RepID=A0A1W1D152_9ZZZZ
MEKSFFFLYSILASIIYLLLLPFLLLLSFKSKYTFSLPARFFLLNNKPLKPHGIWFHSCSFGEAKAIAPLIEALPQDSLRMTTTTQTGMEAISAYTKESRYLAFEIWLFTWIKPQKALVVMEAEFWYLLFAIARKRGAKTLLINARMSDRSYPKYLKMAWLYRHIFAHIDEVYAQTTLDKERLESLGAKNVQVIGNIKLASLPKVTQKLEKPKGFILCGASTHEGEEKLILDAFLALRKENKETKLMLVPRHPERFTKIIDLVEKTCKKEALKSQKYSEDKDFDADIIVVDMLGELINLYAITDLVILGGAFVPIGGHNAGEPAQFGCKIISGKYYFNQRDIFQAIEGITIVEDFNLSKRVLQHGLLKPCRIKQRSDISLIVESIKKVL